VLVATHELTRQNATAPRLICGTHAVTRLLAVVGLENMFETHTNLDAAPASG
jgi:anti-anti-sigma regulatory factor